MLLCHYTQKLLLLLLLLLIIIIIIIIITAVDKIEKNEMGGACGTYGGRERCAQGFGGET